MLRNIRAVFLLIIISGALISFNVYASADVSTEDTPVDGPTPDSQATVGGSAPGTTTDTSNPTTGTSAISGIVGTISSGVGSAAKTAVDSLKCVTADSNSVKPMTSNDVLTPVPGVTPEITNSAVHTAQSWCLEGCSPIISTAAPILQGGVIILENLKGGAAICGTTRDLLKAAEVTLTAFNAACTTARLYCTGKLASETAATQASLNLNQKQASASCGSASEDQALIDECKTSQGNVNNLTQTLAALKTQSAYCGSLVGSSVASVAGIVSLASSAGEAKACDTKLASTAATTTNGVDCTLSSNINNTACICLRAPLTPGCSAANSNTGINNASAGTYFQPTALANGTYGNSTTATGAVTSPTALQATSGAGNSASSANQAATSAGETAATSKSALTADGAKAVAAEVKGLNTKVLNGTDGGGGGGGGSSGGGSYDASSAAYQKYAAYMPGVNRNIASDSAKQITGSAGSTNWEKVSNSYLSNKSNLTGQ